MNQTVSKELTSRFYQWEIRGRGRHVFDFPVELEPEFYPFLGHYISTPQVADDGISKSLFNKAVGLFKPKQKVEIDESTTIPTVSGYEFECDEEISVFEIVLPKGEKFQMRDMEQLLIMLSYTHFPISFEIIGTETSINIQFACRETDEEHMFSQVHAYFHSAIITRQDKDAEILTSGLQTCVIDFGLAEEFMRPICMAEEVGQDPFIGIFASLEHLAKDEQGVIQILFKGAVNPWSTSIIKSVTDNKGGSFFSNAPEMVKLAQDKISSPLYAVSIKVAGQSTTNRRAVEIVKNIGNVLVLLTSSKGNKLQILTQEGYDIDELLSDIYLRESHRLGMILNTRELATLVHFPTPGIFSSKIIRHTKKTKAAPDSTHGQKFILGLNTYHGVHRLVSIPESLRLRHTHIIGATGTGKSTLLLYMIAQDMKQSNGLAVLDPHGDLIESILAHVPKERINDVILIDPADADFPVGFNILSAHSEIEKDILSSDLVAAFKRLSTSWGDQMNSVLSNAILAFLESPQGGTLVDLRRFLVETSFRNAYLKTVADPHVVYYWQHEYPLLKSSSIGSILTRLDTFLRPKLIRNMVAQKKGLDFENILDTRKILLVKLSQGLIGAENSFLLGTFFVSKMYQAAMARQAKSKADRSNFYLYIDEFQNFITPSMSHILSGARKYHLGLILAHQDMQQLQKYDSELASSVTVNAGTRICFRLGDTDAKRFAGGFSYFDAEDLENLKIGEAIMRIEQPNFDFNLSTLPVQEFDEYEADVTAKLVIATSREKCGTPRAEVEKSIENLSHLPKEREPELLPIRIVPEAPPPGPEPIPAPIKPVEIQRESLYEPVLVVAAQEVPPTALTPEPPAEPFKPVEVPRKVAPGKKAKTEHRYLQTFIKRMAESRGYKAIIEESTPDGKGRVDVSLERNGKKIAIEISVTTGDEWEAHNVQKCLAAGYDEVIVCSSEIKNLQRIREQLEIKLTKKQLAKVLTFEPQEVIQYFDKQIMQESTKEKLVKGYRVKVEFDSPTD
ncbi:MAG: type IV secretion system DNA-binding domain-containing protein [bacterium]